MISLKKTLFFSIPLLAVLSGCTKLDGTLGNTLTLDQTNASLGASGPALVLQGAYADIATPFTAQDELFSLEENVTDELASIGKEPNQRIKDLRISALMLRDNPGNNISPEYLRRLQTLAAIEQAIAAHRRNDLLEAIRQEIAWAR